MKNWWCRVCVLLLVLLVLWLPAMEAGRKRKPRCKSSTPMCESDRFDVVFSHYDDDHCKVYKCKCRIPDNIVCPQGRSQKRTDSHGCQYYECITCPQPQGCPGTKVQKFLGDDANGCPTYTCECPPAQRPVCNANEQMQQTTDASGCPSYYCQQVRTPCPLKPTCSSKQELMSAGTVNDCDIYKCVCLTPRKPSCSIGSQPRLKDDGMGCQEYRCVENRSPCPPEPDCPSQHQIATQDGVDANNCIKYVCKCIPLAPISCPDGYIDELATDELCGCQYYTCEPNCEPEPVCPSSYQHPVVAASRSNGCPSYTCTCREAEVISCSNPMAHLTLSKATDGSNCDVYVCSTSTRSRCPVPSCPQPVPTGQLDINGCQTYTCNGGTRSNCPIPFISCPDGSAPVPSGFDANSCPIYTCSGSTRGSQCPAVPQCPVGLSPISSGVDALSCPIYTCQVGNGFGTRSGCEQPLPCPDGQLPPLLGTDATGCQLYSTCQVFNSNRNQLGNQQNGNLYGNLYTSQVRNSLVGQVAAIDGQLGGQLGGQYGGQLGGQYGGQLGGQYRGQVGGLVGYTSSCPPQPECAYQQFRVRYTNTDGSQVCHTYSCINLGQYTGTPKKCLDNPNYCDASQTVETYAETYGRKKKQCQKIVCKGSSNTAYY